MAPETPSTVTPQFVIGVFITLMGIVLMLDRLEVVDARQIRAFWPVVLIAVGTSMLAQRRDSGGRFWGAVWTVVGTWILLNTLGWLEVTIWQMIGPLILILIGGTVLTHALRQRSSRLDLPLRPEDANGAWHGETHPSTPAAGSLPGVAGAPPGLPLQSDPGGVVSLFTVMGEAKRASNDKPFRGGEMTAIMGGCVLDLRQATVEPGHEAIVNILAVMAGHEIWVPSGWTVALDVVPLLGGVDDKRLPPLEPLTQHAPRLRLKGLVLMGGIVIRN